MHRNVLSNKVQKSIRNKYGNVKIQAFSAKGLTSIIFSTDHFINIKYLLALKYAIRD